MLNMTQYRALCAKLTKYGIPYTSKYSKRFHGWRLVAYYKDNTEMDVAIIDPYSKGSHLGLLETRYLRNHRGFETAEQVFNGWKKMYRSH